MRHSDSKKQVSHHVVFRIAGHLIFDAGTVVCYEKNYGGYRESNNSIKLKHLCHHYFSFYSLKNIFLSQRLVMFHKHLASSNFSKYVIKKICALILCTSSQTPSLLFSGFQNVTLSVYSTLSRSHNSKQAKLSVNI